MGTVVEAAPLDSGWRGERELLSGREPGLAGVNEDTREGAVMGAVDAVPEGGGKAVAEEKP